MTEERPRPEPRVWLEIRSTADGFEPWEGLLPPAVCEHLMVQSLVDDVHMLGTPMDLGMCMLCGMGMVRWKTQPEDRSS